MLVALYIGDHAADTLAVRLGWAAVRAVQRGQYKQVTHVEAILWDHGDGCADIASASLRDGGVRIKRRVFLDPTHWWIVDVTQWDAQRSAAWFEARLGRKYDKRGALATVLPGHHDPDRWFCNEAVGDAVGLCSPHSFGPAQFAAVCFSFGRDVTAEFFSRAKRGVAYA